MNNNRDRICVALDGSDRDWIVDTARELAPVVGWLKLGLEAFTAFGPDLVRTMAASGRVFLDLKLHDIPNTVRRAAANCAATGAAMFNVHASGGSAMLSAAVEGARNGADGDPPPLVLAVTVLTSLDARMLADLGLEPDPRKLALAWAQMAKTAGLDGVVASAHEAAAIRAACGDDFLIVTPGIRPSWSASGDQRRIMTPSAAVSEGADVLVIGRPITGAEHPVRAAQRVLDELSI